MVENINVINNGNWRNVFITLQSLGLINKNNLPTKSGIEIIYFGYENFAYEAYEAFFKPYFDEIYEIAIDNEINLSNQEILNKIKDKYNGKDIMYLTESNGRYISSWLNIMRDDYGILDFQPKNNQRRVIYNIHDLKKNKVLESIKNNSIAKDYINNFYELMNEI